MGGVIGTHREESWTNVPPVGPMAAPLTRAPLGVPFAAHMLVTLVRHASEAIVK